MKKLLSAAVLALALLVTTKAHAVYGYVCYLSYDINQPSLGDYGHVYLDLMSQPNCGGTYGGSAELFSTGASPSHQFMYSEAALLRMVNLLRDIMVSNQMISIGSEGGFLSISR